MCVGEETEDLRLDDTTTIKSCEEYIYLGAKINNSGRCENEVADRVVKAKVIGANNLVLRSKSVHMK